jgi:hypothetical protein
MDFPKRLVAIHGAPDTKGAGVTFTLKSEGGDLHTFSASSDVFSAVLQFMRDLDNQVRQQRPAERIPDPLQSAEEIDVFLDLRMGRALLRVHTARGRTVQLELSEELLSHLEGKVPKVLAELRRQKRSH